VADVQVGDIAGADQDVVAGSLDGDGLRRLALGQDDEEGATLALALEPVLAAGIVEESRLVLEVVAVAADDLRPGAIAPLSTQDQAVLGGEDLADQAGEGRAH